MVPLPRRPPGPAHTEYTEHTESTESTGSAEGGKDGKDRENRENREATDAGIRDWYENVLAWPTVPGEPVRLLTGERFDVLDVPATAGSAALRRLAAAADRTGTGADRTGKEADRPGKGAGPAAGGATRGDTAVSSFPSSPGLPGLPGLPDLPGFPVAVHGDRMWLLVAAGGAEELPGILQWLEWGSLPLDLTAIGTGGLVEAPAPPGRRRTGPLQGAAVWMRPPVAGCEVEASLPTMSAWGGVGGAPDLVRLVNTLATECHRVRLGRVSAQPLAFS
ncbi:SCO3374 family protein [Streptomyces phaeofaciens]|uniref:SCO3374 family protein n=1 Tax=Streptomyces phaeofaciens TaxID=68254 RepID=UPI0036BB9C35